MKVPIWGLNVVFFLGLSQAILSAGAVGASKLDGVEAVGAGCEMTVRVFSPDSSFDDPAGLGAQAVHLFASLDRDEFEREMQGMKTGEARNVSELFTGQDARWRLLRPLDTPDDPDALVISPTQVQYLVRMPPASGVDSMIVVGLPEDGDVVRPALVGRLGNRAGKHSGLLFSIEPTDETAMCLVEPGKVAEWVPGRLHDYLQGRNDTGDADEQND